MPAATATKSSSNEITTLFRAHLKKAGRLKNIIASAKAISDTMVIEVDSGNEERKIRYWADNGDGNRPVIAMVGLVEDEALSAADGDDVVHAVQVPTKTLLQSVSAFDAKLPLELRLFITENRYAISFNQVKEDGSDSNTRTITVAPSDSKPHVPVLAKGGYAAIDLTRLNKVLGGLKQNTDILTVAIRSGEFEVSASSRRMQDGWKHETSTIGKASGLFSAAFLKKVIAGAVQIDSFGEAHLCDGQPLRIEAPSEDVRVQYWLAGRETMK